jgi:hypothetical protein
MHAFTFSNFSESFDENSETQAATVPWWGLGGGLGVVVVVGGGGCVVV